MQSYESFTWNDAMDIACMLNGLFGYEHAKSVYSTLDQAKIPAFESHLSMPISDFISKSVGQRPAYFRNVTKDFPEPSKIAFLVLAILGVLRAHHLLGARSQFLYALRPGNSYRSTTAGAYDYAAMLRNLFDYAWPSEVFDAVDACSR